MVAFQGRCFCEFRYLHQLIEKCNLPQLTPHSLHVIKDSHERILAIWIVVYSFSKVCEDTGKKLLSLNCYLRPSTTNILNKLDIP